MRRLPGFVAIAVMGCVAIVALSGGAAGQDLRAAAQGDAPLLGMNLSFYRLEGRVCWSPHFVLSDYHLPGVRADLRRSFAAMRAGGVETLRVIVIHSHVAGNDWRPMIPSAGGTLPQPYRGNLVNLLKDLRALGFVHVQITFSPMDGNEPRETGGAAGIPMVSYDYDPALFDENWSLIRDVRALLKTYGPASTAIDLLGEGAPSDWDASHKPHWAGYVSRMYANYVDAFGSEDVTVSAIAKGMENSGTTRDTIERLENLIDVLRASGRPLPAWFQVHPSWDAGALQDLRAVDEVLTRNGLDQPLVIGEVRYENAEVAAAVAEFMHTSTRRILELHQWPLYLGSWRLPGQPPEPRCANPPWRVDEYAKALRGGLPPKTLTATIGSGGQLSLVTPYGHPVIALNRGTYRIVVRDGSSRHGFRLSGNGLIRRSGLAYRGTRTWSVPLKPGSYTFASDGPGGTRKTFAVLVAG